MQKNITHSKSTRFRRFLRKGYAVFCSLKKEISIGFLSVDVNNCSLKLQKVNKEPRTKSHASTSLSDRKKFENILEIWGLQPAFAVALVSTQNNKVDFFYLVNGKRRRVKGEKSSLTFFPFTINL